MGAMFLYISLVAFGLVRVVRNMSRGYDKYTRSYVGRMHSVTVHCAVLAVDHSDGQVNKKYLIVNRTHVLQYPYSNVSRKVANGLAVKGAKYCDAVYGHIVRDGECRRKRILFNPVDYVVWIWIDYPGINRHRGKTLEKIIDSGLDLSKFIIDYPRERKCAEYIVNRIKGLEFNKVSARF